MSIEIDPVSGEPSTPACPTRAQEVYIAGTQPVGFCHLHGGRGVTTATGWDTAPVQPDQPPARSSNSPADRMPRVTGSGSDGQTGTSEAARRAARQNPPDDAQTKKDGEPKKDEKPGLLRRLWNVIK